MAAIGPTAIEGGLERMELPICDRATRGGLGNQEAEE